MGVFNVADFLRLRKESCTIEGIPFEIMSLTTDQVTDLKSCESYSEMLGFAADYGLAVSGKRVIDDYMSSRLDLLWADEALALEVDPCIKYRVGEKVCGISGLDKFLEDTLIAEREAEELAIANQLAIHGDNLPEGDVTMGQLENDATAYALANNA